MLPSVWNNGKAQKKPSAPALPQGPVTVHVPSSFPMHATTAAAAARLGLGLGGDGVF